MKTHQILELNQGIMHKVEEDYIVADILQYTNALHHGEGLQHRITLIKLYPSFC